MFDSVLSNTSRQFRAYASKLLTHSGAGAQGDWVSHFWARGDWVSHFWGPRRFGFAFLEFGFAILEFGFAVLEIGFAFLKFGFAFLGPEAIGFRIFGARGPKTS